jgi:CRISPR-associated protein Cmr6
VRPLYDRLASAKLDLGTGHAGLWYDKLCDRWDTRWTLAVSGDGDSKKLEWIETVTKNPIGSKEMVEEAVLRVIRLVLAKGGTFGVFTSESRFVTGLGRSHPVENGFVWHPTLGVPYLPGSSVKGMLRSWAEREAEPRPSNGDIAKVFGGPGAIGEVDVLDALPLSPVQLDADVMTPHYAGWTPEAPPADWCGPVPIPFLVTAMGTSFLFAVVPRSPMARDVAETVRSWLVEALEAAGAGAKTSIGYGRFRLSEEGTSKWKKRIEDVRVAEAESARRADAMKTPEGRWQIALEGKSERDILELVRVHLSKEQLSDSMERRAFARAVAGTGLPALWRKGNKRERETQVGGAKLKERARFVDAEAAGDDTKK